MIQQIMLLGQLLLVALVYVFVWRVMRTASRDLSPRANSSVAARSHAAVADQNSTIIPARDVARERRAAGLGEPVLVVASSDTLRVGIPFVIGSGLSIGRALTCDIVLDDVVVSSRHARLVPPDSLIDTGSTNGTLVNGQRAGERTRLQPGDRVQMGSTVFTFEVRT